MKHKRSVPRTAPPSAAPPVPGVGDAGRAEPVSAIWIPAFPLAPSVNDSLAPHAVQKFDPRRQRHYTGGVMRPTSVAVKYRKNCQAWIAQRPGFVAQAREASQEWIRQGHQIRVDVYVAFHVERIFGAQGGVYNLDANNRLKATLDQVAVLLGVDDKHFFAGNCEKVTTPTKDSECTVLRIAPMTPRTLQEVLTLKNNG